MDIFLLIPIKECNCDTYIALIKIVKNLKKECLEHFINLQFVINNKII